jgi:hypothetical protein
MATGVPEEDAKLTNVVTNNSKKKWGKERNTDWTAVAMLVPGQTLHSSIDPASVRTGRWTTNVRHQADGCGAIARWQKLECNRSALGWSNET